MRRFSDEESALILRRASEEERGLSGALAGGQTLEELASIAREAGIDPDAVRRAACLVPHPVEPARRIFPGAPSLAHVRASFPGTLPEALAVEARATIERAMGRAGEFDHDAAGFVWREDHGLGRTLVRVRREGGATTIDVGLDRRGHLLALVVGLAIVVALFLPLVGSALLTLGPLLAVALPLGAVAGATRAAWPMLARPDLRRAERAALNVGRLMEAAADDVGNGAAASARDQLPPGTESGETTSGDVESGGSAKR